MSGDAAGTGAIGLGPSRRSAWLPIATFVGYLAAAAWAKEISLPGPVLIWFPPAGVAIAASYLDRRMVAVVAVAEAVSTAWLMGLAGEYGVLGLALNSVGLALAYGLGGTVLVRLGLQPRLRRADDLAVVALAVVAAASTATILGITVQWWLGLVPGDEVISSGALFWVGDVVGAACVLPALLILAASRVDGRPVQLADDEDRYPTWRLAAELLAPAVTAAALMAIGEEPMRFVYLAFIPVVLVAVRHGVPAAATSTAALCAVMTAGAHVQLDTPLDRSDFQLLLLVLTALGVTAGSLVSARCDVTRERERVSEIVDATPDLVASASRDGSIRYLNGVGRRMLGIGPGPLPTARAFDFLPDQLAEQLMREGMRAAERSGTWTGENRLRRPDGHVFPVSQVLIAHPELDDDGQRIYTTVCRDTTVQHDLQDQLRRAAFYDDATGLPNRALLVEQLARLVAVADPQHGVAVLFCDLDQLARVNETFGFDAGEQAIAAMGRRIGALAGPQDLVGRHGGSQFVLVLPGAPDEFAAIERADQVLAALARPVVADGHELTLSGSVGITLATGGQDHLEALRAAEIALHRAKEAGGGRYALFDDELERRSKRRLEIEDDLHEVLTKATWALAYQPIFDALGRRVVSVEALLRWTHPTRGPVAPFELVRLAESSGSIVRLGREVLRRACTEAQAWIAQGFDLRVNVNVSARQLREPDFVDDVRAVTGAAGMAADRLVIELTETVLATDEHGAIATLRALRDLGCRIALDDFGTGWSSLGLLRELPLDEVKLDRSFITDLTTSSRSAATVGAVIALAEALDLTVVAEGVEHDEQIDALVRLGCHRVQGYALCRPVAPEVVTGMLLDSLPDLAPPAVPGLEPA